MEEREPLEAIDPVALRVAQNDAAFREANEQIAGLARSFESDAGTLPVLCECADVSCTEVVQLSSREYEAVRSRSTWFINAPGHDRNALGWGRVVQAFDRYTIVEKIGDAGEVVAELDPRGGSRE